MRKSAKLCLTGSYSSPIDPGNTITVTLIDYWFHLFWEKTGLAQVGSGNPPRVHDFRHTYAVKRLNLWVQEGKDLNAYLPYLCMYLGHAHLTETDYYLHFVPEFFPLFKEKMRGKMWAFDPGGDL